MRVNLIKGKELIEQNVICTAMEDIEVNTEEQVIVKFQCLINNIKNGKEFSGLEFISSGNITGIPTDEDLLNPAKVDELIKSGQMKNYTEEELKIPNFNATSINTTDSEKTGIFIINGEILEDFKSDKNIVFEIMLLSGQKAKCTLPKFNSTTEKKIKIECVLQEKVINTKLVILPSLIFYKYNILFKMNKILSEKKVNIPNGREIRKYNINLSFGQLNNFKVYNNIISFFFIGFITQPLQKDTYITMIVNLINGNKLDKNKEVLCFPESDVTSTDGTQKQVNFVCKLENIPNPNIYNGLELVQCEDINGIPKDEPD